MIIVIRRIIYLLIISMEMSVNIVKYVGYSVFILCGKCKFDFRVYYSLLNHDPRPHFSMTPARGLVMKLRYSLVPAINRSRVNVWHRIALYCVLI